MSDPRLATGVGRRSRRAGAEHREGLADLCREAGGVQAEDPSQVRDRAVVDEPLARDADDLDGDLAKGRVGHARLLDDLEDAAAEPAARDALLERDDEPLATGLIEDQLAVERLGEPGVDDPDRPAVGLERIGGFQRSCHDRAESDEQQVAALAQDLATADRQDLRLDREQPETRVARVVQGERALVRQRGPHERAQLLLIPGRGDDEVRELALGGQREHALVARAVLADEPGAVDGDQHRLVVLADVVDRLVEGSLQEGRIDGHDGSQAAHREPGGERQGVLLGDADVEEPLRELGLELGEAGAGRHAGGDPDDPPVGPGELDELGREDGRVVRMLLGCLEDPGRRCRVVGHRLGRHRGAVEPVERRLHRRQGRPVKADLVGLGRPVAASLLRPDVHDRGPRQRQRRAPASRSGRAGRGRARRRCR